MTAPTTEKTIEMLKDILDMLALPENVKKIEEAKETNGNEMLKLMQYVFPVVMQIEMDVIKKHGYGEGREGLVKFAQVLRNFERDDAEIGRLMNLIKAYYLPPVSVSASVDAATDVDKTSSS